jgi:hypothetical protein
LFTFESAGELYPILCCGEFSNLILYHNRSVFEHIISVVGWVGGHGGWLGELSEHTAGVWCIVPKWMATAWVQKYQVVGQMVELEYTMEWS